MLSLITRPEKERDLHEKMEFLEIEVATDLRAELAGSSLRAGFIDGVGGRKPLGSSGSRRCKVLWLCNLSSSVAKFSFSLSDESVILGSIRKARRLLHRLVSCTFSFRIDQSRAANAHHVGAARSHHRSAGMSFDDSPD